MFQMFKIRKFTSNYIFLATLTALCIGYIAIVLDSESSRPNQTIPELRTYPTYLDYLDYLEYIEYME